MQSFTVRVFADGCWYEEYIDGAGDFDGACEIIKRDGLKTSDGEGRIWYPPNAIAAVRPLA